MRKFIILLITTISIISCNESNSIENNYENLELNKFLKLNETTSNISNNFLNMGVLKIEVKEKEDYLMYHLKTGKSFTINEESVNLSDYTFKLNNNLLTIDGDDEFKLTIIEGKPYLLSKTYEGFIKENPEVFSNKKFNLLLFMLKEITTEKELKISSKEIINSKSRGCSFWNTYYMYATGGSRSLAAENLKKEEGEWVMARCEKVGGVDTSCLWENHACASTQAYCCTS